MKKILVAFDGTKYSEGASQYAIEIAKASNAILIGVFIQDMRYVNFTYAYAWDQPFIDFTTVEQSQQDDIKKIDLNISLFKGACEAKGVRYKTHLDKGVPLEEVLKESVFADMIIIDSHTGFFSLGNEAPNTFIKDLLVDSHCPVLIVPHTYTFFDSVAVCYDGSPSSVHATKMFSYLFPELNTLPTTVISVNEKSSNHLIEGWNYKDLVHVHYTNAKFEVLNGKADDALMNYLKTNANSSIVVMGAYGRSAISRLLHQSVSNRVIRELNIPVFIAHQ